MVDEKLVPGVGVVPDKPSLGELAIALDGYDDIFSDFDPRDFSQRELSSDFLREIARRHVTGRKGNVEVYFILPGGVRNAREEEMIRRRLREHYAVEFRDTQWRLTGIKRQGILFMLAGLLIFIIVSLSLPFLESTTNFVARELFAVSGWFLIWTGLERFFLTSTDLQREHELSDRMRKASYEFLSREEATPGAGQSVPPARAPQPPAAGRYSVATDSQIRRLHKGIAHD